MKAEDFSKLQTTPPVLQKAVLTDIVLPKKYLSKISSNPMRKKYSRFFSGDNLEVMDQLLRDGYRNSFDLIYIDPPYLTQTSYSHQVNVNDGKPIEQTSYSDVWKNNDEYLAMLRPRLMRMKELLKDTGSIFVHLDWRISHYVKILLDEVFGNQSFRNEIIWCYYGPSSPKARQFSRKHQSIFWYSKSLNNWQFFPENVRVPYSRTTLQKINSRRNGFAGSVYDFSRGKIPEDWWSDIPLTQRYRHEVANFQTQKPKKLLERIISSTTREGDLVGDFFAGSGTTAVVAEELNRKWISCDTSSLSLKICKSRLFPVLKKPFLVEKLNNTSAKTAYSVEAFFNKKHTSIKSLSVRLRKVKIKKNKRVLRSSSISPYSFIDSWAIDWNHSGNVFRAEWEDLRRVNSIPVTYEIKKKYSLNANLSQKIAVKIVDIFGNEMIRAFK